MNTFPNISKNNSIPVWLTVGEAADIINKKSDVDITSSDVLRFAFYGYLTLSIYFQSPIIMQRVKVKKDKFIFVPTGNDLVSKLCFLSNNSLQKKDNWRLKTENEVIYLRSHIMDTPLIGGECLAAQNILARSLSLPLPEKGRFNDYCGVLVCDKNNFFQILEHASTEARISRRLQSIQEGENDFYRSEIDMQSLIMKCKNYFPVYDFPRDACFVVKKYNLGKFIETFSPSMKNASSKISTPLSRLLWLACKHNDITGPLISHPYKLISIFEEWARSDGITDRLSGDTLKKALKRGAPF